MSKMVKKTIPRVEAVNVAVAKNRFSELLGRVAFGGKTVLITRRGRPMAQLVPPGLVAPGTGLRDVKGWLEEDDPFLEAVASIVASRRQHVPRVLRRRRGRR